MTNADSAKQWFLESAHDKKYIRKHFIAISTNEEIRITTSQIRTNLIEAAARCGEFTLAREKLYILDVWVERSRSTP